MENRDSMPLVTIYTCVYNGEKTLHRVFKSVENITYPNIEHIIVNDGSTDNTEALIQEYSKKVSFPVRCFKKENGGKHTALNVSWENAVGEFMIQLDADDELYPESVSFLVNEYFKIPEDIRDEYWCVQGRCVTQYGDFVGDRYPDDINTADWKTASKVASSFKGEKVGLQVTKYLSKYRFPEIKGAHYLPEDIIWKQLNSLYGTWYTNEVVRVYYVNEGGNLSAKRTKRRQFGALAYHNKWCIANPEYYKVSFKHFLLYSICYFVSTKEYRKNNRYFSGIKSFGNKIFLALLYVPAFFGSVLFRLKRHIKE